MEKTARKNLMGKTNSNLGQPEKWNNLKLIKAIGWIAKSKFRGPQPKK